MVLEQPYDMQPLVYQVNSTSQTLLAPEKNQLFIFHIKQLFPRALHNISHLITRLNTSQILENYCKIRSHE